MNDRTRSKDDSSRDRGTTSRRPGRDDVASESRGRDRDDDASDRGGRRGGRDRDDDRNVRSGSRSFTYRERNGADLKKRAAMGNTDFDKIVVDGVKMWTPGDGANTIRFLPPFFDGNHFGVDIHVHYGIGPDRQSYLCPLKMNGEPCPICEERTQALRDGDDTYAKELDTRRRVLTYMIDRDAEKEGLQVWAMPQSIDQDLAKVGQDKRTGAVLPIDHPYEGYDVEFDKEGQRLNTKYKGLAIARNSSELGNDDWLDQAEKAPLPSVLMVYDYKHIADAFGAGGGSKTEDDGDDRGRNNSRDDRNHSAADDRGNHDRNRDTGGDRAARGREEQRRPAAPAADPTWAEVHEMSSAELDKLAEQECPKLDPASFSTDEELADEICAEMGIPKPRSQAAPDEDAGGGRRRLSAMRERR